MQAQFESTCALPEEQMRELAALPHHPVGRQRQGEASVWLKTVAKNRESFVDTCLLRLDALTRVVAECYVS